MRNSSMITVESWFIPIDIILVLSTSLTSILGITFLIIIILDKKCHTIPMLLIANTSLSATLFGLSMLSIAIFTLQNDLQQTATYDVFCFVRAYISYGVCAIFNISFALQAFYRYITVVYPHRLFYQSIRFQSLLLGLSWIYGFIVPSEFVARGEVIYNVNNQICQIPLQLSFSIIYMASCVYLIPISITMIIYYKLIRYVQQMKTHITSVNIVTRAQRELKMVKRIVILVIILLILGFPYVIFILMSFFTIPPKYHFRIAFVFLDSSMAAVMIALYQFTNQLQEFMLMRRGRIEPGTVVATVM